IGGSASGPSRNFQPESCTAVERLQCENLHAFIKKTIFGGRGQGQEGRFRSGETFPVSARAICAIFSGGAARAVVQRLGGRAPLRRCILSPQAESVPLILPLGKPTWKSLSSPCAITGISRSERSPL